MIASMGREWGSFETMEPPCGSVPITRAGGLPDPHSPPGGNGALEEAPLLSFDHSARELEEARHPRTASLPARGCHLGAAFPPLTARGAYLILLVVCSGWGTIPLVAAQADLPAAAIVFARVWIAAAALFAALVIGRRRGTAGPKLLSYRPGLCVLCGVVLAIHWTAMFASYRSIPPSTAVFVVFLAPIGIAVLAPRALGEPLGSRTVAALVLAVGGFLLVAGPTATGVGLLGLGQAALAAATFVALVLLSKPLAAAYGGLRATLIEMVGAGVALVPVAAALDWGEPQRVWLWLVVLGLVHTAVGTALYLSALARVPASHVGILGYLEPVGVVVVTFIATTVSPTPAVIAGGVLIVAAGVVVMSTSAREATTLPPNPEVSAGVPR